MIERHFHDVFYNGKSLADFGVHVSGTDVFNGPEADVENVEVPGRNGDLHIFNERYKNVELKYKCFISGNNLYKIDRDSDRRQVSNTTYLSQLNELAKRNNVLEEEFKLAVRSLRQWLYKEHTYCRLEDTYHSDEYRLAMFKGPFETEAIMLKAGEFDLTFDAKPQRFLKSGEFPTTFTSSGSICNPTSFTALPLVRIYGKGSVTIGNVIITVANNYPNSYIDINCDIQDAYYGTANRNSYINLVDGEFFKLEPEISTVTLGSGITKVEITPRWWII